MTVTYNANGAVGSIDDGRFYYGYDNAFKRNNGDLIYEGKTFIGWGTSAGATVAYYANESYDMQESEIGTTLALYAIWADELYTLQFDGNAGQGMNIRGTMNRYSLGVGITAPIMKNAFYEYNGNYRFTGWNTAADGTGTAYADCANVLDLAAAGGSVTLYAQWSNALVVNFSGGDGATGSVSPINTTYNTEFELPVNGFAKAGYRFDGWVIDEDHTYYPGEYAWYDSSAGPSVTITACWVKTWTVTFDTTGGSEVDPQIIDDGRYAQWVDDPEKIGYEFARWYTAADGGFEYDFGNEIRADTVIYAHWTPIKYYVYFDANGGEGEMDCIEATYDESFTIPGCSYTHETLSFTGWNTDSEGDGDGYSPGPCGSNLAYESYASVTLYAMWS